MNGGTFTENEVQKLKLVPFCQKTNRKTIQKRVSFFQHCVRVFDLALLSSLSFYLCLWSVVYLTFVGGSDVNAYCIIVSYWYKNMSLKIDSNFTEKY